MNNLTKFITELEELEKKATPGEWIYRIFNEEVEILTRDESIHHGVARLLHNNHLDAAFIVAAKDALPKLLACVKVLSEACKECHEQISEGYNVMTVGSMALTKCESIIAEGK